MPFRRRRDFDPCGDYGCDGCLLHVCACCEMWEEYDVPIDSVDDFDTYVGKRVLVGRCQGPLPQPVGRPAVMRPDGSMAIPPTIHMRDRHAFDFCGNWRAVRPDPELGESFT